MYYHIKFQGLGETIQKLEENENIDPDELTLFT